MSGTTSILCVACGRPIALDALACGRCSHCRVAHGLAAADADLVRAILQTREATRVERQLIVDEVTAKTAKLAKWMFGALPHGFVLQILAGVGKAHPDYVAAVKRGFDGRELDLDAPLYARRADLERARADAEIACWTARVWRLYGRVHERIHVGATHWLWIVLFIGVAISMTASGSVELLPIAELGGAIVRVCFLGYFFVLFRERRRRTRSPGAVALVGSIDPGLHPQPLGSAAAIVEWLGTRWADPVDPEVARRATAAASFSAESGEGMVMQVREADGTPRLIVHVPFLCPRTPSAAERRRGDALLAELEARGWAIDLDEKIGARGVLAPAGVEFQRSELRALSDDLRRFCGVPAAFGGISTLVLVTQASMQASAIARERAWGRRR